MKSIYERVLDLRNRISSDGDDIIHEEDYLLLDEILEFIENSGGWYPDIETQINDYNNTVDIYNELEIGIKFKKQEKLLEMYRQLSQDLGLIIEYDTTDTWDGPIDYEYLEINEDIPKALNTYKQIKELENDK